MLLRVVAQSLKPVKFFSQQLPTFLFFRDRQSEAQQWWIRLHSSSNIVRATHAHYAWFTKTYGLYPSHDALQVPTLLGVVASVCRPLPTRTQQLPTLLALQCWELLRPFARSLKVWFRAHLLLLNTCKHFVCSLLATSAREHFTYSGTTVIGSTLLWHPCLISIYYSLLSNRRS